MNIKYYLKTQKLRISVLIIVIVVFVITIVIAIWMPDKLILNNKLIIKGMYGITKNMNELVIIDTLDQIPEIKSIDDGVSIFNMKKGSFTINNDEKVKMFVFKNEPPFIYIEYKRANKLYFNFKNPLKTKQFYRELLVTYNKGALP